MKGFQIFFTSGDVGAHTESLQPQDINSSSSTEDQDSQAPVPAATTSGASESAKAAAALCWLRTGAVRTFAVL